MANAKEFFSGNFLKAENMKGGEIIEILDDGSVEEINTPEGKTKTVLNFQVKLGDHEMTFTPNRANGMAFIDAWGENTEQWIGKRFKVVLVDTLVFGKKRKSIVAEPILASPVLKI